MFSLQPVVRVGRERHSGVPGQRSSDWSDLFVCCRFRQKRKKNLIFTSAHRGIDAVYEFIIFIFIVSQQNTALTVLFYCICVGVSTVQTYPQENDTFNWSNDAGEWKKKIFFLSVFSFRKLKKRKNKTNTSNVLLFFLGDIWRWTSAPVQHPLLHFWWKHSLPQWHGPRQRGGRRQCHRDWTGPSCGRRNWEAGRRFWG